MEDGLLFRVVEATIRERVWRDIDDAHDERTGEAEARKGRAGRGHSLHHFVEIRVAGVCQRASREQPRLAVAGRAFDQLGRGKRDRTSSKRKRQSARHRLLCGSAVEESNRPEIELRVSHGQELAQAPRPRGAFSYWLGDVGITSLPWLSES